VLSGLITSAVTDGRGHSRSHSALSREPFAAAIAALASASEVHYRSDVTDVGEVDARATSNGELVATVTTDGQAYSLLKVGGKLYLRPPDSGLPGVTNPAQTAALKNKWLTGGIIEAPLASLATQFLPPQRLASLLAGGLVTAEAASAAPIAGVRVLAAQTRFGVLYVTEERPYRVVRLAPAVTPSLTPPERHASYSPTASPAPKGGTDFPADGPADTASTYRTLQTYVRQLSTAVNSDLHFNLQGSGNLQCSGAGCTVSVVVTNSISTTSPDVSITGSQITAQLSATVTVGGEPAGGCTSSGSLPVNRAGTISCVDPAAGPVFTSVQAAKKAAAEAQSAAQGGVLVPYYIPFAGQYYVYATAQVDTTKLVKDIDREADESARTYKAPPRGATDRLLRNGFDPVEFPGDPTSNTYPDGKAYFGLEDRGLTIALDYASRGAYDSQVIKVEIPRAEFELYFGRYVQAYDGVPRAEVAIPNTEFGALNRYPRSRVTS